MSAVFIDSATGELKYQGTSGTPAILADGYGVVSLAPMILNFDLANTVQGSNSDTFFTIGSVAFDPSAIFAGNDKITRLISFESIIYAIADVTAEIRLYNVTDGDVVNDTVLTSVSTTPEVVSSILAVGSDIPNSQCIYEIQLRVSFPLTPSGSDYAFCNHSTIKVTYS